MDPSSKEQPIYGSDRQLFSSATVFSPLSLEEDESDTILYEEEEEKEEVLAPSTTKRCGLELLLAPRLYNNSGDGKEKQQKSGESDGLMPWTEEDEETKSIEEEDEDMNAASAVMAIGNDTSFQNDDVHSLPDYFWAQEQQNDSMDDMEMSIESLRLVAQQRDLDIMALRHWSVQEDGKLLDRDRHEYRRLRDALRAYTHFLRGVIPKEDMYYLAILRRKMAELALPLIDGPISVVALGIIVPEEHFYTSKRLFPIGYETIVKVQISIPVTVAFRLRCKIVHGNKKKSPIFVVELENSTVEMVFRSYVASKAWKKAFVHFESLSADDLMAVVSESVLCVEIDESGKSVDVLTPANSENGFGLLRRNITRVLEGLHQVLLCKDYQFWEQRHPISPDVHAKIRSRLKGQLTELLTSHTPFSKDEIKCQLSQESLLDEHSRVTDNVQHSRHQEEKDQRKASKRSVRKAAHKLLEIEIKAHEDAKEAQRRAKEARKSAIVETKMEAARQKEARKEALRLAKEEEKRMKEEEKEIKRVLREEEKRKKLEEKEHCMKRRIEELRQRRQMVEEQKAILENGVVTSVSPRRFSDSRKRKATPDAQTVRQQHFVLLKFVEEERDRRRQIRLWEKRKKVESDVWTRVKVRYISELQSRPHVSEYSQLHERNVLESKDTKFPLQAIIQAADLDAVPVDSHVDLLFVWDFISTFSDCLKLPVLPSLSVFVKMMTLSDGSSPVGDGELDDDSIGTLFSSLHAELLKVLITEYFPLLQMGTTINEFYRTRPINTFSWPELAREVCQFAMEFKRPSADEQLLKSIKGSKSYRDDSVTHPLRQKLHRRGTNLLNGIEYEEIKEEPEAEAQSSHDQQILTPVEANNSSVSSECYGVVLVDGVCNRIKLEEKDQHLVVLEIVATCASSEKASPSAATDRKDDSADRIRVGDYLMFINGHDVRKLSLDDFERLVSELQTPHGLLLSRVVPVAEAYMKHNATLQGATKMKRCGFVLRLLRSKEIAEPFNQPVDSELYPDYYSSGNITEPMDLGTISEKIEDEDYEDDDVESFVDDVQLVWKNCYTYNSMKAEISSMAQKLSAIFERMMKEWVYTTVNRPMIAAEEDNCRNCRTIHAKGQLLLCDRCDAPYHTFCLDSALVVIPTGEWFCPLCLADPSFSPEQFQKKTCSVANSHDNADNSERNENDLTELEKRLLSAIDLLSQESYSNLTVSDRLKVLRVLCELIEETSAVQSVYHLLHEKVNDVRKKLGQTLADLEREWDQFAPPHSSHGVEKTKKFIIDGVEYELTDELLTYLENKAKAELESNPIPVLPENARKKLYGDTDKVNTRSTATTVEDDSSDNNSDVDEEMFLEEFSDQYLVASSENHPRGDVCGALLSRPVCAFCGLEDGILNGPLRSCKQSPLTARTTLLDHYELPQLLTDEGAEMLVVRTLTKSSLATMHLEDTAEGVQYLKQSSIISNHKLSQEKLEHQQAQVGSTKRIVYAINDRVVFDMSRAAIQDHLTSATQPVLLYLTSLPGEAVRASVSIVKCHSLPMMVNLAVHESFIFVQSYRSSEEYRVGFGELSGQVCPGDVLLMVNDVLTRGMDVVDVESLLCTASSTESIYAVFVRPPSAKMRKAHEEWQRVVHDAPSQRARETAFRAGLIAPQMGGPTSYEVVFQDGPLGLALALEPRGVVVKSLNDHPDGTLGQASMSGHILRGDLVERVNGTSYGKLTDLSQFTSWLLSLPRPLRITFSRRLPGGDTSVMTPEEAKKRLDKLLGSPSLLCKQLRLSVCSDVKTYRVESFPLPFEVETFLESLSVIAIKGLVYFGQYANSNEAGKMASVLTVGIGDFIVGLNGRPVSGLSWATVNALCAEMSSTCPVYLHFTRFAKPMILIQAHEPCVESANMAWSECGSMLPRVEKARELERYIKWSIIPRTLALGMCRHGYSFYRFFSDHHRVFVLAPDKKWSLCATKDQFFQLLSYLDDDSKDSAIATQIRWCYRWVLYSKNTRLQFLQDSSCCEYSSEDFLRDGPFSIKKEVSLAVDGDVERYESLVSYHGRCFFLGSFHTQQEAERSLQRAEASIHSTGFHAMAAADITSLRNGNFPSSLVAPYPKAENVVKRILSRKYEFGSMIDRHGGAKPIPISHDVYQVIKRSLRSNKSMLNCTLDMARSGMYQAGMPAVAGPRIQGDIQSPAYAAAQARYQDALKLKYTKSQNLYARQVADQSKRKRYIDPNETARVQQQFAVDAPKNAASFKRTLQALVDQGRSMLAVWNQFAASPTIQTTNGLAYACLSSFEAIKKVVTRIVVDPDAAHPDSKTFVCLHHAYVMGLMCAMATQALTTSQKTQSDSALVKQVADAFATAILSCVDSSNMLRARAINGFATAAKTCEPSQRAGDLSVELHNVANFVLMFVRITQYLSGSSFDDLSNCRPLFTSATSGVESLPVSFVQQINLLENVRQVFYRKIKVASRKNVSAQNQTMPSVPSLQVPGYGMMPGSISVSNTTSNFQTSNQASNDDTLVDVEFGYGPLGVVINYSNHGTIVVTEFSNDNNMIGQAQASGKVQLGDEVYAVNGNKLEVIGMEGFKALVGTSKRPLQVTFRRMSPVSFGGTAQAQNGAFNIGSLARATTQGTTPPAQVSSAMSHQAQQLCTSSNQPIVAGSTNSSAIYSNEQPRSESMGMGSYIVNSGENYQSATFGQFSGMGDNINLFPFTLTPSEQIRNSSLQYANQQTASDMSNFMGDMSGQAFPAVPMGVANYETLPNVFDSDVANDQHSGGVWQSATNMMVPQLCPSGSTLNPMNRNEGESMQMSMDSVPLMPNATVGMGYSTAPPPITGARGSYHSNNATGEFLSYVAGNDPQLSPNSDSSQVDHYGASETTYRGPSDFDIDTRANTSNEKTGEAAEHSTIADVDTEPKSPSISQVTTLAQSDTDGERTEIYKQRDCKVQIVMLQDASSELRNSSSNFDPSSEVSRNLVQAQLMPVEVDQTAKTIEATTPTAPASQPEQALVTNSDGKPPLQATKASPHAQIEGKELCVTDKTGVSRRSSRVSRKITNIADMYDPNFVKAHSRGGAGSGGEAGTEEPTDGDVGELATELLEDFSATIRPQKQDLPRSLLLLRAQLLTIESAIPRDAFRLGRWGRSIRAAWAEMVYTCDASAMLMEAIVFLEASIDPEWLDPCWKASPLPSAKYAITTATIASAAMRLYSLDDAISYGRMKRGGKRKHRNIANASSSRPGFPQKTAIISQESNAAKPVLNPSELSFVDRLSPGVVDLAHRMIHNTLEAQRERSMTIYAYRKARSEIAAITSLTEDQAEQWIQASSAYQAQTAPASQLQSVPGRHTAPKRKHPGVLTGTSGQRSSFSRKRRAQSSANSPIPLVTPLQPQCVELRCFEMKTQQHCFPVGSAQDVTLRSRLERVMDVVLRNELALAFSAPVSVNDVPGYADLIKHPMDLGTIRIRLSSGFYDQRFEMLVQDVNLVWENCFTFNRLDADISKCANRLRSIFNRLFEQWVTEVLPNTPVTHLASEELCKECGQMNAQDSMLLCDSCDGAYHAFCLQPPLSSIPPGNWYCPRCPIKKLTMQLQSYTAGSSRRVH